MSSTFVSFGKTLLTQDTNLGYFSYQARMPSWYHKFREEIVTLLMKQNHVSLALIVYPRLALFIYILFYSLDIEIFQKRIGTINYVVSGGERGSNIADFT